MMASEPKQEQEPPVKQTPFLSYTSLREQVQLGVSKRTDFPLSKFKTALLIIDVQTYCCAGGGDYYTQHALPKMLSNIQKLVQSFRKHRDGSSPRQQLTIGCEVIFTMIQAQTIDGRDLSLDYKLSGVYFAKVPTLGMSQSDIFLPSLQPSLVGKGDIVIPKTSCSVFISTNLDYVLRNLHVEQLVICGQLTEQCVESAVRDAADLGYLVTAAEDACATYSQDRHDKGLLGMKGFCRTVSTSQVLAELEVSSSSNSRAQQGIIMQTENQQPTASSTTVETTTKDKGCTRIPQAPRADTLQSRKRRFPPPSKPRHLGEGCALAILKSLRCSGMKFLRYLSVDTTTTIQNYIIPIDVLLQSGSLVHPINDFNLVFIPDPASLQFLPYISKTAMMFGNVYSSENDSSNHAPQCSRSLLESIVQQALDQHDVAFVSSDLSICSC